MALEGAFALPPAIPKGHSLSRQSLSHDCLSVPLFRSGLSRRRRSRAKVPVPVLKSSTPTADIPSEENLPPGVTSHSWTWPGHGTVRYLAAGSSPSDIPSTTLLLIHGFGVSSRDFLRNIPALANAGHAVLAPDFLGLGSSLPESSDVAENISTSSWQSQLEAFIDARVHPDSQLYLVGNSLGGLIAASIAASRPSSVAGAVLLNPAPFWASLPRSAPTYALLRSFWSRLTTPAVIKQTLDLVYADAAKIPSGAVHDILRPTAQPLARSVFESVLTAPPLEKGFEESVRQAFVEKGVPLAIVYGREDPWVVPLFGVRVKGIVPDCSFYELSPCGHCAQAEAPGAVNAILNAWVRTVEEANTLKSGERSGSPDSALVPTPGLEGSLPEVVDGVRVALRDGVPRNVFERFANAKNYSVAFAAAYASTFFVAADAVTER